MRWKWKKQVPRIGHCLVKSWDLDIWSSAVRIFYRQQSLNTRSSDRNKPCRNWIYRLLRVMLQFRVHQLITNSSINVILEKGSERAIARWHFARFTNVGRTVRFGCGGAGRVNRLKWRFRAFACVLFDIERLSRQSPVLMDKPLVQLQRAIDFSCS